MDVTQTTLVITAPITHSAFTATKIVVTTRSIITLVLNHTQIFFVVDVVRTPLAMNAPITPWVMDASQIHSVNIATTMH